MDRDALIRQAYSAFASYARPEHFTDYKHCSECAEHDETMRARPLSEIGVAELGNPGWCPIPFLTKQAYGYVMPRLIELALTAGSADRPGDSFVFCYLLALTPKPEHRDLGYFTSEQRAAIEASLHYIRDRMAPLVETECCADDLAMALARWQDPLP